MNYNHFTVSQVEKALNTSAEKGLTEKEAKLRLSKHGKNLLSEEKKPSFLKRFFVSLWEPMTIILLISAAISLVISIIGKEPSADTFIILAIVILNGIIGVIQEQKAEKALDALKKMTSPHATVIRDGKETVIDAECLVVGDVLILKKGKYVCGDGYLFWQEGLATDESSLTGESAAVEKTAVPSKKDGHISDLKNCVWAGTSVCVGKGKAIVTATGMNTYMGRIAGMLNKSVREKTPLQKNLAKTGGTLGNMALIICAFIFAVALFRGMPFKEMFLTSVSLAVAAIPEGLPAIVTVILSIGVKQMADRKAVVKRLPAVETLGAAAVICSDKTGTITCNEMTVTDFYGDKNALALYSLLCNDLDSPTENALFKWAKETGASAEGYSRIAQVPFSSDKKYMITVHKTKDGYVTVKKGAPERVLTQKELIQKSFFYGSQAKRVIAFAYCVSRDKPTDPEKCRFLPCGICAMEDPPRPQVKQAVKACRRAGIRPVMITGDQPSTAEAIAKQTGILRKGERVLTEQYLKDMDIPTLANEIKDCSVFARTTPEFKVKIVEAFKYNGQVVAMTGDGVNDAPALKKADIGCAMGKTGTDVAKEAADIILTDDNFSTIIEAVRYGRGIYDNIRRSVRFLLSCNIGEIITVLAAILMSLPSPLSAIMLLWINLVTDSLPAIALGMEKTHDSVMDRKPTPKNEGLFSKGMGTGIAAEGIIIGCISLSAFLLGLKYGNTETASTMCFGVLSFSQLFHAFNMRSEKPFFKRKIPKNPYLTLGVSFCILLQIGIMVIPFTAELFKTVPLSLNQWLTVALLSFMPIPLCEGFKLVKKRK